MPYIDMKRAIFFDLDGTVLTSDKRLTERNRRALLAAQQAGVLIVPATGRLYEGMPAFIRALPLEYALTVNGAEVFDVKNSRVLRREELPLERALEIFDLLDGFDCVYDCYAEGWGYMDRTMYEQAERYVIEPAFLKLVKELRKPVADLRTHLRENFTSIQKIQLFFHSPAEHRRATETLRRLLLDCYVSSSVRQNIEINIASANKGAALTFLVDALQIPRENTLAFGDGSNDITMLRAAGIGVAMANASPEVLSVADTVTGRNDADGVGEFIEMWMKHEHLSV